MLQRALVLIACLCLGSAAPPVSPGGLVVSFPVDGTRVVGTLVVPAAARPPAVLMLHGFEGDRDEEDIYPRAAAVFARRGMASLRIDFRGSGDSGGSYADTTFSRQIADALAAEDFLRADPRIDASRIGVLGLSQGGLVAAVMAPRSGRPRALALWSAVADPPATYEGFMGKAVVAAGLRSGTTGIRAAGARLRQPFFEDIFRIDPLAEIARYRGRLFAAEGTHDMVVGPHSAERYIAAHGGSGELWRAPMDHDFNLGSSPATLDALIGATARFFADALDARTGPALHAGLRPKA